MTTWPNEILSPGRNPVVTQDLHNFLGGLESDSSLFHPKQLRERLGALDELDIRFGDFSREESLHMQINDADARITNHAKAMRARLEAVNTALYESIRSEIVRGAPGRLLLEWIQAPASRQREETAPGLGYDYRDDVVTGVLQLHEPREPRLHPQPEMVFYQPTPVRHILHLITASAFSPGDVFVDLGSGLGHVALLASMLAGVRSFGIEVDPAYVRSAQECAQSLQLSRVQFIREYARAADLSLLRGTVFYLYSPFTGSILADVLARLKHESKSRPIKIGALGPCTCILAKESWLKPIAPPDPKQITVFQRRL